MKKVMLVFGTRPEAIKLAPLCHKLLAEKSLETIICVTGQHREMLDQVLNIFELEPDIDLNLMKKGQDLFDITSSVLIEMRSIFSKYKPDIVLVHGDTTTTMATSIASFYAGIPIGHVEAGLRTHNISSPFPEEFNRRIASIVTKIHFAPTALSKLNLVSEKIDESKISITGNTVIDTLYWVLNKIESDAHLKHKIASLIEQYLSFNLVRTKYVLITGHRRENFGDGILNICEAIVTLANENPDVHFVYPVHLNPNVKGPVFKTLSGFDNIHLIPPLAYEPFVYLLNHCYLVLTDSGGIQEEAPSLGKPVLVMRNVSERPEAIEAGTVRLVGTDKEMIISNINKLLKDFDLYNRMSQAHNPYGDGKACMRIVERIKDLLNATPAE
jgi:UDP-N-acetylglucosamine 2-epimerase (non-hydrolysing)